MADYERSAIIGAPVEEVFAYASDIANLPRFVPGLVAVALVGPDELEVTGQVEIPGEGVREVHGEAWLRADPHGHRLAWGSDGPSGYHGELHVEPEGEGDRSRVSVKLHTVRAEARHGGDVREEIEQGLAETLDRLREHVEARLPVGAGAGGGMAGGFRDSSSRRVGATPSA